MATEKTENIMFRKVKASGRGNCMYNAYAIGLMYFLHGQSEEEQNNILNKLELQDKQRQTLKTLLITSINKPAFTENQIRNTIEPILAKVCRKTAGEAVKKEFQDQNPRDTSQLMSTVPFYLKQSFYRAIASSEEYRKNLLNMLDEKLEEANQQLEEAKQQEDKESAKKSLAWVNLCRNGIVEALENDDTLERRYDSIMGAEIFKTPGMREAIRDFAKDHNERFFNHLKGLLNISVSEAASPDIKSLGQSMDKKLDEFFKTETETFFKKNDWKQLEAYIKHLQADEVWGSEETLSVLHKFITEKDPKTKIGLKLFREDNLIASNEVADIALNYINGNHWNALVPSKFLSKNTNKDSLADASVSSSQNSNAAERTDNDAQTREINLTEQEKKENLNLLHKKILNPNQQKKNLEQEQNKVSQSLSKKDKSIKKRKNFLKTAQWFTSRILAGSMALAVIAGMATSVSLFIFPIPIFAAVSVAVLAGTLTAAAIAGMARMMLSKIDDREPTPNIYNSDLRRANYEITELDRKLQKAQDQLQELNKSQQSNPSPDNIQENLSEQSENNLPEDTGNSDNQRTKTKIVEQTHKSPAETMERLKKSLSQRDSSKKDEIKKGEEKINPEQNKGSFGPGM